MKRFSPTIAILAWSFLLAVIIVSVLCSAMASADETTGSTKLTGSELKAEDLILSSDAIWLGKIIKVGSESTSGSKLTMHGNQAELIQFLRCGTQSPLEVDIPVDLAKGETKPETGVPYIFFLMKSHTRPTAWAMDPYDAIKLLSATDTNIAEVKRLINLPENYHQLPGSRLKLSDVVPKSDFVFVGKVLSIASAGDADAAGESGYYGVPVKLSHVFRGATVSPLSVDFHVYFMPHEDPPKAGQSYIFFVREAEGSRHEASKILPATNENIAKVENLIAPTIRSEGSELSICDDLDTHDALVNSDAIFTGQIVDPGNHDESDSYSFAFPSPHLCGVKLKVSDVLRGTIAPNVSATVFVNRARSETIFPITKPYIFYAKNGNSDDKDPLTILKALPATDANLQMVKNSINPSADSVLSGSLLTPEQAVAKADVIFLAEVTKLGAPNDYRACSVKIFKVVRGMVAKGDVWINQAVDTTKHETPTTEGGSYIFCLSKTDPYNTDDFNVIKAIPATLENNALFESLATKVSGPAPPSQITGQ